MDNALIVHAVIDCSKQPHVAYATEFKCCCGCVREEQVVLFTYYSDELTFTSDELVGLSVDGARELHRVRDVAYLKS